MYASMIIYKSMSIYVVCVHLKFVAEVVID